MALRILRPGPFSTIQDLGRRGYMKDGFPQSGVMDDYSFLQANRLLGNDKNAAAIEMTLMGLAAAFTEDTDFVAAGGDFGAALDDMPIAPNMLYHAKAGAVITFGAAKTGCRCYLAVAGGFDVPPVMGSRSTTVKCRIGGMDGRKLQSGDLLPIGKASCTPSPVGTQFDNPMPDDTLTIRAVPGPQDDLFTEEDLRLFFSQVYTITPESDRMGMRLAGDTPLKGKRGTDIISDGIAFGAVQVPSSGQPIVLMADRQTVGGYAKIATVISCDLHLLAQAKPAQTIRFVKTDLAQAVRAVHTYREALL